ncbi:MAG: DUF3179 domain-containing (seleno)protein, partial [Dehalococcoidia bacterium]
SKDTGFSRSYGRNPYSGYDTSKRPFLFGGEVDERLAALERVVAVSVGEADVAYPFSVISKVRVVHDRVGGSEVVVFHQGGTTSALDGSKISTSRDVGAAAVFDPVVDGRRLSFEWRDGFRDRETGSTWNIFGQATGGPLLGKAMTPVVHGNHFWFAWAAFRPDTIVYQP